MSIVKKLRGVSLAGLLVLAGVVSAHAFDPRTMLEGGAQADEAFRFGAQAYKSGDKSTALNALTYAAHNGHMVSQWKLGRMYADGDGVLKDRSRAFDLFNDIVARYGDARPGSIEARYVSNAFVELSAFLTVGIDQKLRPDRNKARELLQYAASYFRDPDAQYHLAISYLREENGKSDTRQAARWLNKAARKGHIQAQLQLGDLLLDGTQVPRQPVNGLKWLTIARILDSGNPLVLDRQEAAFALADEPTRQKAVSLAEEWVNGAR
ncbi:tetratricopeptide repeat protein [Cohaesibacter celericrescens]|uniref:Exopolysaccharide biosynthesis protein n=1 Tax=Cohaesibacter celericrescens TaxID=2067669 RepID=A0A2N5XTF7_9HYPH|nr:tetratricopeptide repeat protein [Cohaesibacter celericrescens]PLW77735.1 exopolysaccharide biosynthesis protein [Cohaesibacter celericrescens]